MPSNIRPSMPCPCGSTRAYAACCLAFHRNEREAPDAESLMRSRYAAFAAGEYVYLWKTLHEDHPDRAYDQAAVVAALRQSTQKIKYMGLTILDRTAPDADGVAKVLFHAKIFEKGRDCSFIELSDFLHDGTGWRYRSGDPQDAAKGSTDGSTMNGLPIEALTIATYVPEPQP